MLPGDSEWQQLLHIFKLLGTPNEDVWPGVSKLKDWHLFPQWAPQDLRHTFPYLSSEGIDLMQQMFVYNPIKRMSVRMTWTSLRVFALKTALCLSASAH